MLTSPSVPVWFALLSCCLIYSLPEKSEILEAIGLFIDNKLSV